MRIPKWLGSRHEVWVWHQDWMLVLAFVLGSVWGHIGHDIPWTHIVDGALQGGCLCVFAQFVFRAKRVADVPATPVAYAVIPIEKSVHSNN